MRVAWDITDRLDLTLTGLSTRQDGTGSAVVSSLDVKRNFRLLVPESPADYQTDPDVPPRLSAENDMGYGELSFRTDVLDLKVLASHQVVTTDTQYDFEGSPTPLVTFRPYDMGARITSAEVQFLSNSGSWMSRHLEWIGGYYFFDGQDAGFRDVEFSVLESLTDPFLETPLTAINELLSELPLPVGAPDGVNLHLDGLVDTRSHALFAQGAWYFADDWRLTVGGRYVVESRTLTESTIALQYADRTQSPPLISFRPRELHEHNFSPKIGLDYRVGGGDTLLFVNWRRGFKTGTFNVLNILKPPDQVQSETITSIEFGLKGATPGGALHYEFAAFLNRIRNLQVLILSLQSSGAVTLDNAPRARIRGLDFSFAASPLPQILPGLRITASGAILHGRYTDYPEGNGFDENSGRFRSELDFTGNATVRTPRFSGRIGMSYQHQLTRGSIDFGFDLYHNSGYFFDAQNAAHQQAYRTLQARIGYRYRPLNLSISVYGENLTNAVHYYNQFQTDFNTVGTLAPPRLYGVRLGWRFGARGM